MGFLLIVAIIVIVLVVSSKSAKETQKKWESAAQVLGLGYFPGGLMGAGTISGTDRGHRVAVTTFNRSSGKSSQTYTKYTLHYRDRFPVDFRMSRQGFPHGMGQVFGLHDIEVGNPDFDDQVLVKGGRPGAVIDFLTPARQNKIIQMVQSYTEVVITNEHVEVVKRGKDTEPGTIIHCVRALLSFCDSVIGEPDTPPPSTQAYEIKKPTEKEVPGVQVENSPELPPPAANIPEPPPEEEKVPDADAPLDLRQTVEAFFGNASGGSLLVSKTFDEQFKGRAVVGSGVLKRVSKFSYDPVFANCRGVKATIEICEIAGSYSKVKVAAIVKFPESEYEALQVKVETPMEISGRLVAQDSMTHQVYVSDSEKSTITGK